MKKYFMISDTSGELYDTRDDNWFKTPLRLNYCRAHRKIKTVSDLKATLRNGRYAWPGGYPLFFITSDGAALSFDTARSEFRLIADSIQSELDDGWRIIACEINYEDSSLFCEHSGAAIESAYGVSAAQ